MCFKLFGPRCKTSAQQISPIIHKHSELVSRPVIQPGTKDAIEQIGKLKPAPQKSGSMAPRKQEAVAYKPSTVSESTPAEVLRKFHMPPGLLPDTVTDYEISEDGKFSCRLSKLTYVTFGSGADAKQVCYKERITGVLKDLKLTNLAGVSAKKFFLWVSITAIGRDDPDSAYMKFYVGSVSISLPAEWFASVPSPDK